MKKLLPVILVICLMLCSCGSGAEETTIPETTAEPETAAPVVYRNPLNGEILDEPYKGRIFSVSINNIAPAMPHCGVKDADVFFEMYVNDYCTRGLALYSDIKSVEAIGSIRSTRYNFTDIANCYNSVMIYSGGSGVVLADMEAVGIDNIVADAPVGYRDADRRAAGYSLEHTLFASGESIWNAAVEKGYETEVTGREYGMQFAKEGTPVNGEAADEIEICFTLHGNTKKTTMKYDKATDKYVYWQYGEEMVDDKTGEKESFKNVIVIHAPYLNDPVYHVADIFNMGTGYYACGGKIVPIKWWIESPEHGFTFITADDHVLLQEVGNTYIALAPEGSAVTAK